MDIEPEPTGTPDWLLQYVLRKQKLEEYGLKKIMPTRAELNSIKDIKVLMFYIQERERYSKSEEISAGFFADLQHRKHLICGIVGQL